MKNNKLRNIANISGSLYNTIHGWLKYKYGHANKCESKKCNHESHNYNWCLIHSKEYDFKRSNFKMLCVSCHKLYDMTEEIRKKMSKINSGKNHPMYGVHRYGKDAPNYGKHHSEETKRKMSKNHVGTKDKKFSKETKRKMSIAHKKYWKNRKIQL